MSTSKWSSRAGGTLTALIAAGVVVAGLGSGCAEVDLPLVQTRWTLVQIETTDGATHPPITDPERDTAHLIFASAEGDASARVSGSGGCNRVSGGYTLDGHQIALSEMISTRMSCGPDIDAEEHRFLEALMRVEGYAIRGSRLVLSFDGGQLTFTGVAPPGSPPH